MNNVVLMGRLTRDPEVVETGNGTVIASYTIAVDRAFKSEGQPEADFIRCKCFGKAAEFADKWLRKGVKVAVSGRLETGSYQREDGTKVYTTEVILTSQEFAESKKRNEEAPEEKKEEKKTYTRRR